MYNLGSNPGEGNAEDAVRQALSSRDRGLMLPGLRLRRATVHGPSQPLLKIAEIAMAFSQLFAGQ
jgi:hypothetical protein